MNLHLYFYEIRSKPENRYAIQRQFPIYSVYMYQYVVTNEYTALKVSSNVQFLKK